MGKLHAALEWAARGFPVFPLVQNGKTPLYEDTWYESATTDPDTIRAMWTDPVLRTEHDYNIGMDCTGRIVFDIDVKEGKDGLNQYAMLQGTYETLVVQTPSGGYHCYFEGPDSANAQDVASGIDIRSHHGFVVAPGSTIDGRPYKIVRDRDPIWVPLTLERVLREPYARREVTHSEAIDSAASIEAGRRFLESAPVAIQGQRGDETTFVTAARLCREFALSVMTAYSLMAEHWNERCVPPWQLDELMQKVENAAQYGTADLGRLDPSVQFRTVSVEPPPSVFQQAALGFGNALEIEAIPPRPWLVDRLLMLQELTLLLAPGSAGKSSVSLAIAAHVSMGLDFAGYRTHNACKVIVYNGEDDKREQSRRLYGVCMSYNLDYRVVKERILLLDESDFDMKLVGTNGGRIAVQNDVLVNQLVEIASSPDVGLIVYDPLVDIHDVDESDNPQMNFVMKTMKRISREANVASLILHHTSKGGTAKQEDRVGNVEIGRGAGGIANKARIAFTLLNASQSDAEDYGLQDSERNMWVRLDDAKMNFALANGCAAWFRKEGVRLPNGDVVGVLKVEKLEKNSNHIRMRIADLLISTMSGNNTASMALMSAIAVVKQNEPLWANKADGQVKQQLEGMFMTAVEVRGQTLRLNRTIEGAKQNVVFTLT